MNRQLARWLLATLGFTAGAGLFAAFVAIVLVVLAQSSGAGWQQRHAAAAERMTL